MIEFPDVLGLKLVQAEKMLNDMNCSYRTVETVSQRKQTIEGDYRVIRQRVEEHVLVLIICKIPG